MKVGYIIGGVLVLGAAGGLVWYYTSTHPAVPVTPPPPKGPQIGGLDVNATVQGFGQVAGAFGEAFKFGNRLLEQANSGDGSADSAGYH